MQGNILSTCTFYNVHSVTSNAVARNIYPQEKNLDIDTLYPSEDGKIENYFGTFSGNVPETKFSATLKVIRIKKNLVMK